jgi:predicted Zn-dependent protease
VDNLRIDAIMHTARTTAVGLRWLAALLIAGLAAACATNPVTGKREFSLMSEAQEIAAGQQLDLEVRKEMGVYEDPALQQYVENIGFRLAAGSHRPNLPWHFAVVDVPAVNAFALPGGYIYVTRGILPFLDNEAELAGVLGHEIGHVTARHAAQSYTRATSAGLGLLLGGIFVPSVRPFSQIAESGLGVMFLKYSRDDEREADRLGAEYAAREGWEPSAVPNFLTTLGRIDEASDRRGIPNWLSTHPQPEDRAQRMEEAVQAVRAAAPGTEWAVNRDGYLRRIDGLVYGDNPADGIVRGSTFLHPDLRIGVEFPAGWEINNGKTQVMVQEPGSEVYMVMQMVENARGRAIDDIAAQNMSRAGYTEREGRTTTINGLDAYVGTYEGSASGMGRVLVRAAHIVNGRTIFFLAGLAQPLAFDRAERDFSAAIRSFRPLARREADEIRPNRVAFYTARAGDTWQSIAAHAGGGNVKASTLAVMNNHPVDDQPRAGERLKIVVAG